MLKLKTMCMGKLCEDLCFLLVVVMYLESRLTIEAYIFSKKEGTEGWYVFSLTSINRWSWWHGLWSGFDIFFSCNVNENGDSVQSEAKMPLSKHDPVTWRNTLLWWHHHVHETNIYSCLVDVITVKPSSCFKAWAVFPETLPGNYTMQNFNTDSFDFDSNHLYHVVVS